MAVNKAREHGGKRTEARYDETAAWRGQGNKLSKSKLERTSFGATRGALGRKGGRGKARREQRRDGGAAIMTSRWAGNGARGRCDGRGFGLQRGGTGSVAAGDSGRGVGRVDESERLEAGITAKDHRSSIIGGGRKAAERQICTRGGREGDSWGDGRGVKERRWGEGSYGPQIELKGCCHEVKKGGFPAASYALARAAAVSAAWLDERQLCVRGGASGTGGGAAGMCMASIGVDSAPMWRVRVLCRHQAEGPRSDKPGGRGGGEKAEAAGSESPIATGGEFGFLWSG
ncbi:hypothetical protein FB451DRAFT_1172453 [Mycena latifolia]|nr:hypothetical protein FB451DRAFT_1172453 [Mycena latifolia]